MITNELYNVQNVYSYTTTFSYKQYSPDIAFIITRGHARFARSPLVVRLGDSRRHSNNPFVYTSLLQGHPHRIVLFKMITMTINQK